MKAALGLGLPVIGGGAWSPDDLGASLLGWWDAGRADKITRSGGAVSAWDDTVAGYSAVQAISGAKPTWDANSFGGVRNLVIRSQELDISWPKGDVTVTPDAANDPYGALTADLLTEGSAGTAFIASTVATVPAGVTMTGAFYLKRSAVVQWVRLRVSNAGATNGANGWFDIQNGVAGAATAFGTGAGASVGMQGVGNGWYRCWVTVTLDAGDTTGLMFLASASANGASARVANSAYYAWGAQLTRSATVQAYVATTTAAAWDLGRPGIIFDGSDDELTLAGQPFSSGAAPGELWALVDQASSPAETGTRRIASYGGTVAGNNDLRQLARAPDIGASRGQMLVGDGAASTGATVSGVDFSGCHVIRGVFGATTSTVQVDALSSGPSAVVPATGATCFRIGAATFGVGFWSGQISAVIATAPLTVAQADQLLNYLKARGGIP